MSSTSTPSMIVPFGIWNPQEYIEGREAAVREAGRQGFREETFVEIRVQWGDQDANGHVNNVVPYKWMEAGRLAFIKSLPWDEERRQAPVTAAKSGSGKRTTKGMIVGSVSNSFLKQIHAPDTILVSHRIKSIGGSKLVLEAFIYSYAQQAQVCRGEAHMILFDYGAQKTYKVPEEWRKELEKQMVLPVVVAKL